MAGHHSEVLCTGLGAEVFNGFLDKRFPEDVTETFCAEIYDLETTQFSWVSAEKERLEKELDMQFGIGQSLLQTRGTAEYLARGIAEYLLTVQDEVPDLVQHFAGGLVLASGMLAQAAGHSHMALATVSSSVAMMLRGCDVSVGGAITGAAAGSSWGYVGGPKAAAAGVVLGGVAGSQGAGVPSVSKR